MAKQLGRAMLVKIGDGAGSEVFTTLCGLMSKELSINNEMIDVTTADCTTPEGVLWRESLAGVSSIDVSGSGLFEDSVQELRANTVANSTTKLANFQIIIPAFGTYAGEFFMTNLTWSGDQTSGLATSLALASNGPITFTAA
jgi:TP901-1 family phage major tail protein